MSFLLLSGFHRPLDGGILEHVFEAKMVMTLVIDDADVELDRDPDAAVGAPPGYHPDDDADDSGADGEFGRRLTLADLVWPVLERGPSPEAIAMMQSLDLAGLERDELIAVAVAVQRNQRMLEAFGVRVQALAAGPPPGSRKVDEAAAELSCALGLHPLAASASVAAARNIARRLPVVLHALERGEIALHQARQIESATRELDPATAADVAADALKGDPRRLKSRLTRALIKHAPESVKEKTERNRKAREVLPWSDPAEGVAGLSLQGPLELVAQIKAAIDNEARARATGECRPIEARRFDTVLGWARTALGLVEPPEESAAAPGADAASDSSSESSDGESSPDAPVAEPAAASANRPKRCTGCGRVGSGRIPINVTVSLATLLHLTETPGTLNGDVIPAEIARELAADGSWRRWVVDPVDGRLLDVGAHTYRPGAKLDRHVRGRDGTCRFPSCDRPSVHCELDHTVEYHTKDGETVQENLCSLCPMHHKLKHDSDWTYRMLKDGTVIWTAPSGRTYIQPPEFHGDDEEVSAFFAAANRRARERAERKKAKEEAAELRRRAVAMCGTGQPWTGPLDPDDEPPF
jgi:hypothetical protein